MADLKLTATYIKVLDTIYELNQHDCYPLNQGIYKILVGFDDKETKTFKKIKTYGTLVSTTSKKVCNYTLMLYRYNYIEKFYHKPSDELYFKITDKGIAELINFHKNSKRKYMINHKDSKPTILKLNKCDLE